MRGRRKLLGLAVLLSLLLIIPLVLSSGVIDVSQLMSQLGGSPASPEPPLSSSTVVSVSPVKNITDYEDPVENVSIGSTVTFHVDISDVTDLYTWNVNMSWNPTVLNLSSIIAGDFLGLANLTSSEELGLVINSTDYSQGYTAMAETVLGEGKGKTEAGTGRLVTIVFEIVGYGCSDIIINGTGTMPTMLLNSTGGSIPFTMTNGFFKNKLFGDAYGDGMITPADIGKLFDHWTDPPGLYPYSRCVDTFDDGQITPADIGVIFDNWDRSVTLP